MIEPGRKYAQGIKKYRYSINAQEKETELNENITTAEYWEYDSRLGRRWNVDPKPNLSISPYSCFAGNPIWLKDVNGDKVDSLDISTANGNSEKDLRLTINADNQKYININQKGEVTMSAEFNRLTNAQRTGILNQDAGLSNINDMVTSTSNFLYQTTFTVRWGVNNVDGSPRLNADGTPLIEDYNLETKYGAGATLAATVTDAAGQETHPIYESFTNLANTRRGDEAQMTFGQRPTRTKVISDGNVSYTRIYDGVLTIAPGQLFAKSLIGNTTISVPRKSLVFHELRENFLRVNGAGYQQAHDQASREAQECIRCNLGVGYSDGNAVTSFTLGTIERR